MAIYNPFSIKREAGSRSERAAMYARLEEEDGSHDEKHMPEYLALEEDYRDLQLRLRHLRLWAYSLGILFLFSFVLLLLAVGASTPAEQRATYMPSLQGKSPYPTIPMEAVTFERHELFANASNPLTDAAWSEAMPNGDGFIVVDEPSRYNLPPGKQSSQGELYDVTVFHQLHCLNKIRTYLVTMQSFTHTPALTNAAKHFINTPDEHVYHCFDYIRQGLMCNADMTLEWPRTEANGDKFAVDGWGIQHQCKQWDHIMTYMEYHRYRHSWEAPPPFAAPRPENDDE